MKLTVLLLLFASLYAQDLLDLSDRDEPSDLSSESVEEPSAGGRKATTKNERNNAGQHCSGVVERLKTEKERVTTFLASGKG